MKQIAKIGILVGALVVGWSVLLLQWRSLSVYSRQVGVRSEETFSVGQVMDYKEKNPDRNQEITAWSCKPEVSVRAEKRKETVQADVYHVYGAMQVVFPCPMAHGNYPYEADTKGCLISSGLAQQLYGAENVVGQSVVCQKKEWWIRGVIKEEDSFLAVCTQKREDSMTCLEVVGASRSPVNSIQQLAPQIGMADISYVFDGSLAYTAARLLVGLPLFLFLCLMHQRTECEASQETFTSPLQAFLQKIWKKRKKFLWWLALFLVVLCFVRIPDSLIPTKWSDFEFWSRRAQEIWQSWEVRLGTHRVYWEEEVVQIVRQMMLVGGLACGICFWRKIFFR